MKLKQGLYFTGGFLLVFLMHYLSVHMYAQVCTPPGFTGVLQSILLTGSPMCKVFLEIINFTHTTYASILAGFLTMVLISVNGAWNGLTTAESPPPATNNE